ncbi:AAA family ATPase [Catenovulum sp. SM1970]|uniref:AAA family ATPase n=1 Tax=Marinifaba aquimaris TaxID=2741323 RepID=UPI0015726999|nr:AAA family ATPase [Marinifaba aquimaris]NTS78144.1 AAA family ATPase [Marinifaba aquimaris]
MSKLIIKSLLVYSPNEEKGFHTEFSDSVNIIHGRNTSGKSTLIQSIIYAMGINDSKDYLNDINNNDVFFRLDCTIERTEGSSNLIFIRSDDTLVLQKGDEPAVRFDGINGNNSFEYAKYKELLSKLIGFDLVLQKQTELVSAPLEAAILPYYISQSVGWVYIRESIGDYRFYKDFKLDYLDYYCGIESGNERIKKYNLEKEKKELNFELNQLDSYEAKNEELKVSKLLDERFKGEAENYLESYQRLNEELSAKEAEHTKLCNKSSMLKGRQKVLSQIITNIKNQRPKVDQCPTCNQKLPGDLKEFYRYTQDVNDAIKEKARVKENIKSTATKLNSTEKILISLRKKIEKDFSVLRSLKSNNITFDSWLDHNTNLRMLKNISIKKAECKKSIDLIDTNIEKLGDGADIDTVRKLKEKEFLSIFKRKADILGVKLPKELKYQQLYSINSFPYQGVELHQLLMAYNFAFYEMVMQAPTIHSFPFLLDAIFKEDIDSDSRTNIFKFLSQETKSSGQVVFSVAEYKGDETSSNPLFNVDAIKSEYFPQDTKLICIGDSKSKRAFLSKTALIDSVLIHDTMNMLEVV